MKQRVCSKKNYLLWCSIYHCSKVPVDFKSFCKCLLGGLTRKLEEISFLFVLTSFVSFLKDLRISSLKLKEGTYSRVLLSPHSVLSKGYLSNKEPLLRRALYKILLTRCVMQFKIDPRLKVLPSKLSL